MILTKKILKIRVTKYLKCVLIDTKRSKSKPIMKNKGIIFATLLVLLNVFTSNSSFSQTDFYSCNVVCLNQPDYIMAGVKVDLYDANNEFIATTYTNEDGIFLFNDLELGNSYVAKFSYDAENTFVDMSDAFQILLYRLGMVEFNDVQMIAADVDGDDDIDIHDFVTVLVDFYLHQEPFPVGNWILPDWAFTMSADKTTGGPAGTISTGNIDTNDDPDKSSNFIRTNYEDIDQIEDLNTLSVPVYLNQISDISGMGFIAEYNENLFDIMGIESPIDELQYFISNGQIRVAFTQTNPFEISRDAAIMNIIIKQKYYTEFEQTERINILESTHILDAKGNKIPFIEFSTNEFKTAVKQESIAAEVYPNPCQDYFFIQVDNNLGNSVEYTLYNALGQLVDNKILNGSEQIKINTSTLEKGLYYYHINYQSKSITGPISIR